MRRNKRFKEKRIDKARQISVSFIQQFAPAQTFMGNLYDLSESAIKVIIEKQYANDILNYMPKTALTKFRFSDKYKMTVSISSIKRIDDITDEDNKIGIVLTFDVMSKEDQDTLKEIVNLYAI
jgi:hypothetical protein